MSQGEMLEKADLSGLRLIKKVAGERIRSERRRRHIKQEDFAHLLGISPRWLREIEAGNPGTRLEDHLGAAMTLGLPTGYIGIAIQFIACGLVVPKPLLYADCTALEQQCIDMLATATIQTVTEEVSPRWWTK